MIDTDLSVHEEDRQFFQRELDSFLPDKIFDAHTHLWRHEDTPWTASDMGYDVYIRLMDDLCPGRVSAALFLPGICPNQEDATSGGNQWISKQISAHPNCRGEFLIRPTDDPEWVRQEVRRLGLHGLKCYHTFSSVEPTWEAEIPDYLPETLVKVAHEEGWVITLHMVRSRAVADASNIHWIRNYCEKYPDMKLILAHSARGFQPAHNLEGLSKLTGLDNLYFDTSANCEPIAHQAILRILGHEKMLYGSDLPVSHMRGRNVAVADSFIWIYEDSPVWGEKHLHIKPVLIGLEHLRSMKWACWSERLSDRAVEDIFYNNAARLFGL